MIAITTPSGRTVEVHESSLESVAVIIEDARGRVFDEVLEQLDTDIARFKECGDLTTAESYEVLRAKVHAKKEAK